MGDAEAVAGRFRRGITDAMGIRADVIERPGTTVVPDEDRSGTLRVSCYSIGAHCVLWCDPAVADRLEGVVDETQTLTEVEFIELSRSMGATLLGGAVMKTLRVTSPELGETPGRLHRFDWSKPADVALMADLVAVSSADDLDEAEVDMDELDDLAVGLLDEEGRVGAYASSRPFEHELSFGDIGVVVRSDLRSGGWGRAVVAALMDELLLPDGIEPLYRCDTDNYGSDRLSRALGFEPALSLVAADFPAPESAGD